MSFKKRFKVIGGLLALATLSSVIITPVTLCNLNKNNQSLLNNKNHQNSNTYKTTRNTNTVSEFSNNSKVSAKVINFDANNRMLNFTYDNNDVIDYLSIRSLGNKYKPDWIIQNYPDRFNLNLTPDGHGNNVLYINNNYPLASKTGYPSNGISFGFYPSDGSQAKLLDATGDNITIKSNEVFWSNTAISNFNGMKLKDGVINIRNSTTSSYPWLQYIVYTTKNSGASNYVGNTIAVNNWSNSTDHFNKYLFNTEEYLHEYKNGKYKTCVARFGSYDGMLWKGLHQSSIKSFTYNKSNIAKITKEDFIYQVNDGNIANYLSLNLFSTPKMLVQKDGRSSISIRDNPSAKSVDVSVLFKKSFIPNLSYNNPNNLDNNWVSNNPMSYNLSIPYSEFLPSANYSIQFKKSSIDVYSKDQDAFTVAQNKQLIVDKIVQYKDELFSGLPLWFDVSSNISISNINNDKKVLANGVVEFDLTLNNATKNGAKISERVSLIGFKRCTTIDNYANRDQVLINVAGGQFSYRILNQTPAYMINEEILKSFIYAKRDFFYNSLPSDFSINDITIKIISTNFITGDVEFEYNINKYLNDKGEVANSVFGKHKAKYTTSAKIDPTSITFNEDAINKNQLPSSVSIDEVIQAAKLNFQSFIIWDTNEPIYANSIDEIEQMFSGLTIYDTNNNVVDLTDVIQQDQNDVLCYYTSKPLHILSYSPNDVSYQIFDANNNVGTLDVKVTFKEFYNDNNTITKNNTVIVSLRGFKYIYQIGLNFKDSIMHDGGYAFKLGNPTIYANLANEAIIKDTILKNKDLMFNSVPADFDLASNIFISSLKSYFNDGCVEFQLTINNANNNGDSIKKKIYFYGYKLPICFNQKYIYKKGSQNYLDFLKLLMDNNTLKGRDIMVKYRKNNDRINYLDELLNSNSWKSVLFSRLPHVSKIEFSHSDTVFKEREGKILIKDLVIKVTNAKTSKINDVNLGDLEIYNLDKVPIPWYETPEFFFSMLVILILIIAIIIFVIIRKIINKRNAINY